MAFRIKRKIQYLSKEKQMRETEKFVQKTDRQTKEEYLGKVGLFKEEAIKEMPDEQLNELVVTGLRVKGF